MTIAAAKGQDRFIAWCTQEGASANADWVPTANNTAGTFDLITDGSIMCGRRSRGGTLIWTTTDLWLATYIGGTLVYGFAQVGNKCGIIASRAVVVSDTAAYWMGTAGFYLYDGFVKPIPCEVQDYVFGSLNRTYAHYIWAFENPAFGEVTWFYPHASQTEVTRYVTYSYRENHWVTGTLARTAGVHAQPTGVVPVLIDAAAAVFDHETASARNSEGTVSLESGPVELGDGDRRMSIQKVIPDDDTVGDVTLTIFTAANPDTAEVSNGPYTLTAQTSIRPLSARHIRVKLTEAVATAWRVGVIRLGLVPSSRR